MNCSTLRTPCRSIIESSSSSLKLRGLINWSNLFNGTPVNSALLHLLPGVSPSAEEVHLMSSFQGFQLAVGMHLLCPSEYLRNRFRWVYRIV